MSWTEKKTPEEVSSRLHIGKKGIAYFIAKYKKLKISFCEHIKRHDSLENLRGIGNEADVKTDNIKNWL